MMAFLNINGLSTFSNYYFCYFFMLFHKKKLLKSMKKNFFSLKLKNFRETSQYIMDRIIDYFALFTYYSQSRIDARLWMRCLERI